jgi:hypothetical protein
LQFRNLRCFAVNQQTSEKFFWHCKNSGKVEKRERNHVSLKHIIPSYTYSHKLLLKWRVNDINLDIHSKLKSSLNFLDSFFFKEKKWNENMSFTIYISHFLQEVCTSTFSVYFLHFTFGTHVMLVTLIKAVTTNV